MPTVVNLILTDDSDQFGVRILRTLNEFVRRLFVILLILGDYRPAKQFLSEMVAMGLEGECFIIELPSWFDLKILFVFQLIDEVPFEHFIVE